MRVPRRRSVFPGLLASLLLGASGPARAAGTVSTCDEPSLDAALAGGGAVTFACDGTIMLTTTKAIAADTSLDATGRTVTLSGGNSVRHFIVSSGVTLSLTSLTIANGHGQGTNGGVGMAGGQVNGGAILSSGTLTAVDCTFSGNTVTGGNGGNGTSGSPNGLPAGFAQ